MKERDMRTAEPGHFYRNMGHMDGTLLARTRPYGDNNLVSHCPVVPKNGTQGGWDRTFQPFGFQVPSSSEGCRLQAAEEHGTHNPVNRIQEEVRCVRCGQTGHRAKDCPWPVFAHAHAFVAGLALRGAA